MIAITPRTTPGKTNVTPITSSEIKILRLKGELDGLRPLHGAALANLASWYDVEMTYTSNAIEGNTLTRSETAIIIEKGVTISGKSLAEHNEAIDHHDAVGAMRAIVARGNPLCEADVLALHKIVMGRSKPTIAGSYATTPRRITGSTVVLPGPLKIPGLMEAFGARIAQARTPSDAFEAHFDLVAIHPFADGNGRTARLLMNAILLKGGYPPVLIGPDERAAYIKAIDARATAEPVGHGIVDPTARRQYRDFMDERLITSLKDHVDFISREPPERTPTSPGTGKVPGASGKGLGD